MSNTGRYALVPLVVVGLLLPAGLLLVERAGVPQLTVMYLDHASRLLIPAFAVWWPLFVFKERIEGDGKELLYFLRRKGEGITALFLVPLYWLALAPFASMALGTGYFTPAELYLLLARCVFITAFAFFAAFALQSGVLALILAVAVNLAVMPRAEDAISNWALTGAAIGEGPAVDAVAAFYALFSAGLFWLGEIRSRRFTP